MANISLSTILPGDNRDQRTRFHDDVGDLATLASFLATEMENKFTMGPSVKAPGGNRYFFADHEEEALRLFFSDIDNRARSLALRRGAVLGIEHEFEEQADAAWQAADQAEAPKGDTMSSLDDDPLGDLEGAIATISGFCDAIGGLAMFSNDPEARLRGITSIYGAMYDELEKARQAVRDLYGRKPCAKAEAA